MVMKNGTHCPSKNNSTQTIDGDVIFHPRFSCAGTIQDVEGISVSWYEDAQGVEIPFVFKDIPLP